MVLWGLTSRSTHYRSFRRRFYRSDDPTNSVIALKDDSLPGQGPIPQAQHFLIRRIPNHILLFIIQQFYVIELKLQLTITFWQLAHFFRNLVGVLLNTAALMSIDNPSHPKWVAMGDSPTKERFDVISSSTQFDTANSQCWLTVTVTDRI